MSVSKSLPAYSDVVAVLRAVAETGGTYTLTSHGAAHRWRLRAHMFRKLYREKFDKPSPFDHLVIRLKPGSPTLHIELAKAEGTITLPSGEQVDPASAAECEDFLSGTGLADTSGTPLPDPADDLLASATDLARELLGHDPKLRVKK